MHRKKLTLSVTGIATLYVASGLAGGALAGALLGGLGQLATADARAAAATLVAAAGVVVGVANVAERWRRPLQCNVETPQRWVYEGPVAWPVKNGLSLGFGGFTRLGFMLWYLLPFAALLCGSPLIGAAIWGAYGAVRTGAVVAVWRLGVAHGHSEPDLWLLQRNGLAHRIAGVVLVLVSVVVLVGVGA